MNIDLSSILTSSTLVALFSLWWQRPDRGLRQALAKDVDAWSKLPAGSARDELMSFIEHEVHQLTDRTRRQRLQDEARVVRGLLLVCAAALVVSAVGASTARDHAWVSWAQTGLALFSTVFLVFVVVYGVWWVSLIIRSRLAPG